MFSIENNVFTYRLSIFIETSAPAAQLHGSPLIKLHLIPIILVFTKTRAPIFYTSAFLLDKLKPTSSFSRKPATYLFYLNQNPGTNSVIPFPFS